LDNRIHNWRGRDGKDPSVDIAKDADQRFWRWSRQRPWRPLLTAWVRC